MYNEVDLCSIFFDRVIPIISNVTENFEIICVNDGSKDKTLDSLSKIHSCDSRIKIINLSRNFGKDVALTAGYDHAIGDIVIPIDSDLQDPPELIPKMVERWKEGYDTVVAIRSDRKSDTFVKRVTAEMFYRILGRLSDVPVSNAGDFRLLDRSVVEALKMLPERNRFMKGLYGWVGFNHTSVEFTREKRVAGTTKYKYWAMWNQALDGILSFSTLPLRIWTYLGFIIASISGLYGLYIVIQTLVQGVEVPGYASLYVTVLFLSGVNMIGIGILGEYVGRIFLEVKNRPNYIIKSRIGFDGSSDSFIL